MNEIEVGVVKHSLGKVGVAAIDVTDGNLTTIIVQTQSCYKDEVAANCGTRART